MASQREMEYVYSTIDGIFRRSMGDHADFSCAMYDGDFGLSLEEAQARKHEFIRDRLGLAPGSRVIDLGCGWGPFLAYARRIGVEALGLTLSRAQADICKKSGLDARVQDCRNVSPEDFGQFDAIVSLGAFEHFSSKEEYLRGEQPTVYRRFFEHASRLLPPGGRFYLQSMTFGPNMIAAGDADLSAPRDSNAFAIASMAKQFPGSWLPYGEEQIVETASPHFTKVWSSSGRLDYIETIRQWRRRYRRFSLSKYAHYATLLPRYISSRELRDRLHRDQIRANLLCFERHLLDHTRMVLERT